MKKIRILCVGRKQEPYLRSGIEIYEKKLKRYCEFELVPLKEADYGKGSVNQWNQKEWKIIEKQLNTQAYTIACDERGRSLSSTNFAKQLQKIANSGFSKIDFVIGGPYGLPQEAKAGSKLIMSLSQMTLTHQMVRLLLVEQLYRAFTIINGEKYHH